MSQLTKQKNKQDNDAVNQNLQTAQYGLSAIPYHTHNGVDSPLIQSSTSSINGRSHGPTTTSYVSTAGKLCDLATNDYVNGITWDATGHGFKVIVAGQYIITAMVTYVTATAGDIIHCMIYKNGSVASSYFIHCTNQFQSEAVTDILSLVVGDEITMFIGDEGHTATISANSEFTYLAIAKV